MDASNVNIPRFDRLPRAVAIDLDGTLLDSRTQVSERNAAAVRRCVAAGIPVIMVSARGDKLDQEYARNMGADGYIIKPFNSKELLDTVSRFFKDPK